MISRERSAWRIEQLARQVQVRGVEGLQQHEQTMLGGHLEQFGDARARQHPQYDQHAPGAGGTRLQHLVGIHDEVLAHGGYAEGREHAMPPARDAASDPSKREGSVSTDTAAAPPRAYGADAPKPVVAGIAQHARGGGPQFEFCDDVEARRRQAQRRRRQEYARARRSSAPSGSRCTACATRCALDRAISSKKPLMRLPMRPRIAAIPAAIGRARPLSIAAPAMLDARRDRSGAAGDEQRETALQRQRRAVRAAIARVEHRIQARRDWPRHRRLSRSAEVQRGTPKSRGIDSLAADLAATHVEGDEGPMGVASSQPAAPCTTQARSICIPTKVLRHQLARWPRRRHRSVESAEPRDW